MGPIALLDKSFVQMLNEDEAAIFDAMFGTNICPMFYVETLADIAKTEEEAPKKDEIVRSLARKMPILHSYPNVLHSTLCLNELSGMKVDMSRRPIVAGGQPVRVDGKVGVVFQESPEAEAFRRWQVGEFEEIERRFAARWRQQLRKADHAAVSALAHKELRITDAATNLASALAIAERVVAGNGQRYRTLRTAFALLGLNERYWPVIRERWKQAGGPPLMEHAPYTAHCLKVEVLFHVAIKKKLISPDRVSNKNDMAYLFYLPFCMLFISNDKLHQRIAPLLLNERQMFVLGQEMKNELANLNELFSELPDEEQELGLFHLAAVPPDDETFLTTRIWKKFGADVTRKSRPPKPSEQNRELIAHLKRFTEAADGTPAVPLSSSEREDMDLMSLKRTLPLRRGKWRFMPPGIENNS